MMKAIGCAIGLCALASPAFAQEADSSHFHVFLADQVSYDDNLYRLPDAERRDDLLNSASAGVDGLWLTPLQAFSFAARIVDNRFQDSDELNHTSGNGTLQWRWQATSALSGRLGGEYSRTLAGFANRRTVVKDILEHTGAFADFALRVGSRWSLKAGARQRETEHSAPERFFDGATTSTGSVGLEYRSSLENTIELNYRYTEGSYDSALLLDDVLYDRDFEESAGGVSLRYALGAKTRFDASAGYLRREYPGAAAQDISKGEFSGVTWDAALLWKATEKIELSVSGWRRLRAHLDAESDYFVAQGGNVALRWSPREKFGVSLEATQEDQDYLGASLNFGLPFARNDTSSIQELSFRYDFLKTLQLSLSGRAERRSSDVPQFRYDDKVASVNLVWFIT